MTAPIPLADQIAAVKREIAMRRSVYPHRIRNGKMTEAAAATEIERMEAVLATLERFAMFQSDARDRLREAFEAFAAPYSCYDLGRGKHPLTGEPTDYYTHPTTQATWAGWLSAAEAFADVSP